MKYITSIWTTIALVFLMVCMRIADPALLEQTRLNVFDSLIKTLPEEQSNEIVLLNIGEESLEELGQFPWPRQYYAQMIADLRNRNAGMIGFTIMFPEADRFGGDEVFASWIKDNGIILTQTADEYGRSDSAPYVGYATFGTSDPLDFIYKYKGLVTDLNSKFLTYVLKFLKKTFIQEPIEIKKIGDTDISAKELPTIFVKLI